MFNLKLKNCSYLSDPLLENLINICENLNENYYFAINNKNQIITIKDNEINLVYELNNEFIQTINEIDDNKLIAFGHLPDLELICLIYENGSICTINLDRDEFNRIDLGFKLVTVDFSPEYDKIVLTTDSKLILLNSYFEEINRSDLNDQKQGAIDVLNVGWGKKETQFHGSEGKQARTIKKELIKCSELDDLKPRITWRDDGVYFASSVVDPINLIRKIRVYDNEGILQQTSDEQSGLEYLLSWKPNSNLITSSINLNTGHFIVFFEKNGQRFDEFRLPYKNDEFIIEQLLWSYVADCLVIFGEEKATKNQIILIYTMKNYHWYCKQKLIFKQAKDGRICKLINQNQLTNEFQPLNLKILFNNGRIGEYVYLNQVHTSSDGDTIVIDGKQILFTSFQYSTIPPPMYGYSLEFNNEVNEICFCQSNDRLLVKLADNSLHLIERTNNIELDTSIVNVNFQSISFKQPNRPLIFTKYLKINIDNLELDNYYQFNLTDDKRCYALSKFKNELLELNLNNNESKLINLNDKLIKLITLNTKQLLVLVDSNGFVWCMKNDLNYKIEAFKIEDLKTNKFNQIRLRTPINSLVKLVVLGNRCCLSLYSNYFLFINHLPIQGSDCNSFLIHNSNCLMYTTNDHKLRSIWLDDIYHHLNSSNDLPDYDDDDNEFRFIKDNEDNNKLLLKDNIKLKQLTSLKLIDNQQNNLQPIDRTVERGSRLVASSSDDCKVIIQMPRGNLEIITPRLLLLDRIKLLLNTIQYWSAFELIKKHRINLNLIVDFDLNCFLINCENFIEQMSENNNLNDLNLFLSELSNENVLDTLYSNYNRLLRDKVNCDTSTSLFQLKFPELFSNLSTVSANLGDRDCTDGKSIHLNNYLLPCTEDTTQSSTLSTIIDNENFFNFKSMNLKNYLLQEKSTKLKNVCSKLRTSMIQLDEKKYFIPILLTYIKESKESIGTALIKIHQQECKKLKTESLNYLKYIIDINILIKEALNTYDLNVARMVYSISNHDPKEYLPLIAKFETYQLSAYRNYKIDLHLKNYDMALKNLIQCSPFSDYSKEIFDLIEQKHLYETAIDLFKSNKSLDQYLNQIYSIYGDYLLVKKYFNEALIVFKKGENYQNAIKAAQIANDWNQLLECSALAFKQLKDTNKLNGDQDQLNLIKTFQTVAEQLDTKEYARHSSFIYGFYLNNWNQAMRVLIKNFKWADVYRLLINDICENCTNQIESTDNNSINLDNIQSIKLNSGEIDELIDLADRTIQKHYEEIVDQLNELLYELRKHTERLQKVRENKLKLIQTMNQADNLNDLEDEFLNDQSTVSSVNSLQSSKRRAFRHKQSSNQSQTNSLRTNRAARRKNKSNQQQNQYRLKVGSRDEDLALIYHIRKCIKKIEKLKKTIKLLVFTLSDRNFDDLALKLQLQFDKLLKVSAFVRSFIWPDEQNETEYLPDEINVNAIQDINLQKPPKIINLDWKIFEFRENY